MASFIFGFIFIVVAIVCFGGSFYFYKKSKDYLAKVARVQGTVKDFQKKGDAYYPIFEFQPPSGNPITITSNTGRYPPAYEVGEQVAVLYDPSSPHEAKLDTIFGTYLESLITAGAGGLSLIIGLIITILFDF